jgi:hypothetical protein
MHGNPNSLSLGFVAGLILLLGVCWCGGIYLIALMSGWHRLAQRFRCERGFEGKLWRFQTGAMRWATAYRGILTLGANESGMYLAMLVFFKMGHPALFVPWSEITVSERRRWMMTGTQFVLGREEQIPLWLFKRLGDKLLAFRPAEMGAAQDVYLRPGLEPPRAMV